VQFSLDDALGAVFDGAFRDLEQSIRLWLDLTGNMLKFFQGFFFHHPNKEQK
jgi:hypothetical protein